MLRRAARQRIDALQSVLERVRREPTDENLTALHVAITRMRFGEARRKDEDYADRAEREQAVVRCLSAASGLRRELGLGSPPWLSHWLLDETDD